MFLQVSVILSTRGVACMVAPGGGMHGCLGGMVAPGGACMVAPRGACMVASGGQCAWLLPGGVHGCSGGPAWLLPGGGMCGCSRGVCVVFRGACVVFQGGMHGFFWGGVRGFVDEIRSMSGRYASYWNAFLFFEIGSFETQTRAFCIRQSQHWCRRDHHTRFPIDPHGKPPHVLTNCCRSSTSLKSTQKDKNCLIFIQSNIDKPKSIHQLSMQSKWVDVISTLWRGWGGIG